MYFLVGTSSCSPTGGRESRGRDLGTRLPRMHETPKTYPLITRGRCRTAREKCEHIRLMCPPPTLNLLPGLQQPDAAPRWPTPPSSACGFGCAPSLSSAPKHCPSTLHVPTFGSAHLNPAHAALGSPPPNRHSRIPAQVHQPGSHSRGPMRDTNLPCRQALQVPCRANPALCFQPVIVNCPSLRADVPPHNPHPTEIECLGYHAQSPLRCILSTAHTA